MWRATHLFGIMEHAPDMRHKQWIKDIKDDSFSNNCCVYLNIGDSVGLSYQIRGGSSCISLCADLSVMRTQFWERA